MCKLRPVRARLESCLTQSYYCFVTGITALVPTFCFSLLASRTCSYRIMHRLCRIKQQCSMLCLMFCIRNMYLTTLPVCRLTENTRTIRFYQLPNIMVVLFPRHAIYGDKLNDPMTVPQQLNMRKWVHETSPELAQGVSLDYDLQSIVTHHGRSSTGGHCTATCFHGPQPGMMHFCAIRQYAYLPHQC